MGARNYCINSSAVARPGSSKLYPPYRMVSREGIHIKLYGPQCVGLGGVATAYIQEFVEAAVLSEQCKAMKLEIEAKL